MRRVLMLALVLSIAGGLFQGCAAPSASPAFRSFPPKTAFVPYADRPIIVDGNLAGWGALPPVPPSYTRERESLKVDHAFWLAWHEDGLYGAVMVGDTDIQVDPTKIWDTDGFKLFLELDHARSAVATENSVTISFAPCPEGNAGPAFISMYWPGLPETVQRTFRAVGKEEKTGTVAAWARTEDGYNLEFHIPAEVLEPAKMQPGTKIGMSLNVVVNGRVPYQFHGLSYEAATEPDTWGTGLFGQR